MSDPTILLKGLGASAGVVEGIVRVVLGNNDRDAFKEGEILVTRITDPTMVAIMAKSSAIVCDVGSITSHPSIVSRELGIPCVVNTKQATSLLKDGMRVKVDGGKGEVYLLK